MWDLGPGDPSSIAEYTLEQVLGEGGMGRVYLGRSRGGRHVAVKVVRPDRLHDPRSRARFRREVDVARRVGGIHTPAVHAADPDGAQPWLATVYVPGPTLRHRIAADGPLDLAGLGRLGAGLAEALVAFHEEGIVHRDLKPDNIIMGPDGPCIVDFGIAHGPDSTHTSAGAASGTEGFIAPELIESDEVSSACDVFAFGAVLVRAAGGLPFGGVRGEALRHRVLSGVTDVSALPVELRPMAAACLARDPAKRPSASELLAVLSPVAAAGRVSTTADRPPSRAAPPAPVSAPHAPDRGRPPADPEAATATATAVGAPLPWTTAMVAPSDEPRLEFRMGPWHRAPAVLAALLVLLAPSGAVLGLGKPWPLAVLCLLIGALCAAIAQARPLQFALDSDGVSFSTGILLPLRQHVRWDDIRCLELDVRRRVVLRITTRQPPPKPPAGRDTYILPEPHAVHVLMPAGVRITASRELAGSPRSTASLVTAALALFAPGLPVQPLVRGRRRPTPHVLSERPRTAGTVMTTLLAFGQLTALWSTDPPWPAFCATAAAWTLLIWAVPLRPWRVTLSRRSLRVRGRRRTGRRVAAELAWADIRRAWPERTGRRNELHVLLRENAPCPSGLRTDPHPDGTLVHIPLKATADRDSCVERITRYAPPHVGTGPPTADAPSDADLAA
ncbi:serine/threonine-protein kinase [Streptomyces sp. NPDC054849]